MDESSSGILHSAFMFRISRYYDQTMKHAKTITLTSVLVLVFAIVTPLLTTTADAAAVLESPPAATANIGASFEIVARGRAGPVVTEDEFRFTYVTRMTLEFTIEEIAPRGVLLRVQGGMFTLNDTEFRVDEGVGFAARPQNSEINVTVVFGFKINMTGPNGEAASLAFVGGVKRTQRFGPVLIMRGILNVDDAAFVVAQLGRIHRA